jgi:hypothetical protein
MTEHTPGPWRWEVGLNSKRVELCGGPPKGGYGKFDLTVMSFARYGMSSAAPVFWWWQGMSGDPKRADALAVSVQGREHHAAWFRDIDHPDARLIAAAPDLLEALTDLLCYHDVPGPVDAPLKPLMAAAFSAIAKATGASR